MLRSEEASSLGPFLEFPIKLHWSFKVKISTRQNTSKKIHQIHAPNKHTDLFLLSMWFISYGCILLQNCMNLKWGYCEFGNFAHSRAILRFTSKAPKPLSWEDLTNFLYGRSSILHFISGIRAWRWNLCPLMAWYIMLGSILELVVKLFRWIKGKG